MKLFGRWNGWFNEIDGFITPMESKKGFVCLFRSSGTQGICIEVKFMKFNK